MLYHKFYILFTSIKRAFRRQSTAPKTSTLFSPKVLLQLFVYSATFAILLSGLKVYAQKQETIHTANMQKDIANHVVRLHVIANSDSSADQTLKLQVRDEIITSLQKKLKNAKSVSQAKEIILNNQTLIKSAARKVLQEHNNASTVSVSLRSRYFPVKRYGDLTFPAGTYQALCIEIGKARGQNWWCVLFPSLCFVDETTAVVPDESKKKLQNTLSKDSYESLKNEPKPTESPEPDEKPELRSGIMDWFADSEK